jgi:hypothetical protein
MRKNLYLVLAVLGLVVPYYFLYQFLSEGGFSSPVMNAPLFVNNFSAFFTMDLIISIIVFWAWMFDEVSRLQMKNSWVYMLATLAVGLSFALPLFLYFRERKLDSR